MPMRGEVAFDGGTRAAYATDSSNYRHIPIGVAFPVDEADVVAALRVCAELDAPVLARGAGTSLAGQAVNVAVVLDTSRHMTRILEIDPERRIARVQPGVVLDDLRRETERFGLTFGPDPATHAWCTLGGMIGNNSCGSHSVYTGKTVDNVDRLRVALYGGELIDVGADPEPDSAGARPGAGGDARRPAHDRGSLRHARARDGTRTSPAGSAATTSTSCSRRPASTSPARSSARSRRAAS